MTYKPVPFEQWTPAQQDHLLRDVLDGKPSPHALDDRMTAPVHDPDIPHATRLQMMQHAARTRSLNGDAPAHLHSYELSSEEEDAWADAGHTAGMLAFGVVLIVAAVIVAAWGIWSLWPVLAAHWGGK